MSDALHQTSWHCEKSNLAMGIQDEGVFAEPLSLWRPLSAPQDIPPQHLSRLPTGRWAIGKERLDLQNLKAFSRIQTHSLRRIQRRSFPVAVSLLFELMKAPPPLP